MTNAPPRPARTVVCIHPLISFTIIYFASSIVIFITHFLTGFSSGVPSEFEVSSCVIVITLYIFSL